MSGYWWVRSGRADGDNIFNIVEERSLVGIGWPEGVAAVDLSGWDFEAISEKLREVVPDLSVQQAGQEAGMLDAFVNTAKVGDIVLTGLPNERRVLIGYITGECEFNANPEHRYLTYTRKVQWHRTDITYDAYSEAFRDNGKTPVWGQATVWNAAPYAAEIEQMLGSVDTPPPSPESTRLGFRLERELQEALAANIAQLEPGLNIVEGGIEMVVGAGRLDIAATDTQGRIVVIELKAGTAQLESIAQLLSYMGSVHNPEGRPVRGILVAHDFESRVVHAARAAPNVALREYSYQLSFRDAEA